MTRAATTAISPFFIVSNVDRTIAFYREKLGFETTFLQPDRNPFFAIIRRDGAQIFLKSDANVTPLPNPKRHRSMRWDAYVFAPEPDALAAEFLNRGAVLSTPLRDTGDGLRGFELTDPDGYVLFFGRPKNSHDMPDAS
jgi:catechol 2,3-dioxygenase-like lactoylglutathione lyase family enzyme